MTAPYAPDLPAQAQPSAAQQSAAELLVEPWPAAWTAALAAWGPTTRLAAPVFHTTPPTPAIGSFAWFDGGRVQVHIDLTWIVRDGLEDHAVAILAHEIGHHVMAAADARTRVIVAARVRLGRVDAPTPGPMGANLWHDLLINDRLQRTGTARLAPVWQRLRAVGLSSDPLMSLVMRANEVLWDLPPGTLVGESVGRSPAQDGGVTADLETYAQLTARVVRAYRRDVIGGAGGFAALVRTFLGTALTDYQSGAAAGTCADVTATTGLPQGLASDPTLMSDPVHPLRDPVVMQGLAPELEPADSGANPTMAPAGAGPSASVPQAHGTYGSSKDGPTPADLAATLAAMGEQVSLEQVAASWYRELAAPLLVRFPVSELPASPESVLGGLEIWDVGEDLSLIDWSATVTASPVVVPGITTRQREVHTDEPRQLTTRPVDLDLYVDSSGSMPDGRRTLAPITLAGVVLALSALRAGASVQVTVWSGKSDVASTGGFTRDANVVLLGLMAFFGGGTQFPLHLLRSTHLAESARAPRTGRSTHIAVISDSGISTMFPPAGSDDAGLAAQALAAAGGGGSLILNIDPAWRDHLPETGDYDVYSVRDQADLVPFASDFARRWWGGRS